MNLIKRYTRGPLPLAVGGSILLTGWAAMNLLLVLRQPLQGPQAPQLQEKLETTGFYMLEEIEDQGARPDRPFDPETTRARADRFYEIYGKAIASINAAAAGLPEVEEALVRAHEWMSRADKLRKSIGPKTTEAECRAIEALWRADGSQAVVEFRLAALGLRSIPAGALEAERRMRLGGLLIVLALATATGVAVFAGLSFKPKETPVEVKAARPAPNAPLPSLVEASAAAAVEHVREAILTMDPNLRILSANPAAEKLFGYPAAQLSGTNLHALMPSLALRGEIPENVSSEPSAEAGRHQSGRPMRLELSLHNVNRQGRRTLVAIAREAVSAAAGEPGEIPEASVVADMARFCPAPLVIYDTEGCLVHVNEAFSEAMGADFDQVHGQPYWRIFLEGDQAEKARREWLLLAALNLPDSIDQEWRTFDGRRTTMTWARSALRDNQGRVRFVVAIGNEKRAANRGMHRAA